MTDIKNKLGKKLLELRGERTLYDVSMQTMISRISLRNYERSKHLPAEHVLQRLADFYKYPYEALRALYPVEYDQKHVKKSKISIRWIEEPLSNV